MHFTTRWIVHVFLVLFMVTDVFAALIPPFFLDCVVAIGNRNPDSTISWEGTGFLVGKFLKQTENGRKEYRLFLVTNKHVFKDKKTMVIRFNPQSGEPSRDFDAPLVNQSGDIAWTGHSADDIDVAVIPINAKLLDEQKMKYDFFRADENVLNTSQMSAKGMTEGDFVYVLGFPMGIVDPDRQYVIARSGSIARIRDVLDKHGSEIIVDAFVFPGNSGGPVVSKPEQISIQGTKSQPIAYLIGIVKGYIPYKDIAVSLQTKRPRIVFEENSGLSAVIPANYILETIEAADNKVR